MMSAAEGDELQRVVAAVLHLGNVAFTEGPAGEACVKADEEDGALQRVVQLLNLDMTLLTQALTIAPGPRGSIRVGVHKANALRDCLARTLYRDSFRWVVQKCNERLHPPGGEAGTAHCIHLVDMPGFVVAEDPTSAVNSLSALCINAASERLTNLFVTCTFVADKSLYREWLGYGIDVPFADNSDLVQLLLHEDGLLPQLDKACQAPQGQDETFQSLFSARARHPKFKLAAASRPEAPGFVVAHTTGSPCCSR